jgi:hypothetical protein
MTRCAAVTATRVTLAGSTVPAAIMSTYLPVSALKGVTRRQEVDLLGHHVVDPC